jgi:hypothetical protein
MVTIRFSHPIPPTDVLDGVANAGRPPRWRAADPFSRNNYPMADGDPMGDS